MALLINYFKMGLPILKFLFLGIGVVTVILHLTWWLGYQRFLLQPPQRSSSQFLREIMLVVTNAFLIVLPITLSMSALSKKGHFVFYHKISEYGWVYYAASTAFFFIARDLWFYALHRLLHRPFFYKHIHYLHHLSRHTQPLTSYSMHPLELGLISLFQLIFLYFFPFHGGTYAVMGTLLFMENLIGHSSFTPINRGVRFYGGILTTSYHHYLHHQNGDKNYGLSLDIWDRWLGSSDPKYLEYLQKKK